MINAIEVRATMPASTTLLEDVENAILREAKKGKSSVLMILDPEDKSDPVVDMLKQGKFKWHIYGYREGEGPPVLKIYW